MANIRFNLTSVALSPGAVIWLSTLCALVPLSWLLFHGQFGILAFFVAFSLLTVSTLVSKQLSICLIIAYLFLLGDIRRILGSFIGFPPLDPQLLVGPAISVLLALPILMKVKLKDSISKAVVGLMVVMTLEIVNPRQGPIAVGLAGAMFYLAPLLWFWIGRRYGTNELLNLMLYRVVIPIAVFAAVVGLYQTYVGFLPWEAAWVDAVGSHYHALHLNYGFIRAFGFSVNGVEYANLQLIGCACVLAAFFAGRRSYILFFPLLASTLFLASSRTAIVKLIFAIAVAWALSSKGGRGWAVRLPLAIAVLVGVLAFSLSQVTNKNPAASAASSSAEHQVEGLSHPLDSKKSTAGIHTTMLLSGLSQGLTYPIGSGLGSVTLGSTRLGGGDAEVSGSTEYDVSDAFVSMGLVGGLLYLFTIYLIVRRAIVFGQTAPKFLGLPTIALLASMVGNWVALGQYATGPLVWFIVGVLARHSVQTASVRNRVAQAPKASAVLDRKTVVA